MTTLRRARVLEMVQNAMTTMKAARKLAREREFHVLVAINLDEARNAEFMAAFGEVEKRQAYKNIAEGARAQAMRLQAAL